VLNSYGSVSAAKKGLPYSPRRAGFLDASGVAPDFDATFLGPLGDLRLVPAVAGGALTALSSAECLDGGGKIIACPVPV